MFSLKETTPEPGTPCDSDLARNACGRSLTFLRLSNLKKIIIKTGGKHAIIKLQSTPHQGGDINLMSALDPIR